MHGLGTGEAIPGDKGDVFAAVFGEAKTGTVKYKRKEDAANADAHDKMGTFRQRVEWEDLFGLLDLKVVAHGPCNSGGLIGFRQTMEYWLLRAQ